MLRAEASPNTLRADRMRTWPALARFIQESLCPIPLVSTRMPSSKQHGNLTSPRWQMAGTGRARPRLGLSRPAPAPKSDVLTPAPASGNDSLPGWL